MFRSRATDRFSIQRTLPQGGSACALMPPRYPCEMRREVFAACEAGESTSAIATRLGVSETWVRRLKRSDGAWHPPSAGRSYRTFRQLIPELSSSSDSSVLPSFESAVQSVTERIQKHAAMLRSVKLYFAPHPARNTGEILCRFWTAGVLPR